MFNLKVKIDGAGIYYRVGVISEVSIWGKKKAPFISLEFSNNESKPVDLDPGKYCLQFFVRTTSNGGGTVELIPSMPSNLSPMPNLENFQMAYAGQIQIDKYFKII